MNRRNVLGDQMFENRTTWIVVAGIVATALQFIIYHFAGSSLLGILLAAACLPAACGVVQLLTGEVTELLGLLLIPCLFSVTMAVFSLISPIPFLPGAGILLLNGLFAWLLPVCYAIMAAWLKGNPVSFGFPVFYRRATVFFYLVYVVVIVYGVFVYDRVELQPDEVLQPIPFATLAAYIEAIIKEVVPWQALFYYFMYRMLFYIPYGFGIALTAKKLPVFARILLLLVLPMLIEVLQLVFALNRCDIDDFIFAFVGGLLGLLSFQLFNVLFLNFTGRNYDGSEPDRDYYGRMV